jgi:sigma-B regulation protein RsbU (phosphoserine phosphatase)
MISSSRILIVDDDPHITTVLELILASGNFEDVVVAENADEAFEMLDLANDDAEAPPLVDVIVLDVMMPGVDGIEACARIRQTRRYRDIPIIMCSGLNEITSLNQAFIAGAHDYLTKPIQKVELIARVRSAMRLKRELDRRRIREMQLRSAQPGDQPMGDQFIDANTGLPNQLAFQVAVRNAIANARPHGLLSMRISDIERLLTEVGPEAALDLSARVVRAVCALQAPLDWNAFILSDGLFMLLAPSGSAEQLALFGKRASGAIDALRIVHGHSLQDDFVRLNFAAGNGRGTELLTLPAELIRSLEQPGQSGAIIPNQTRAA